MKATGFTCDRKECGKFEVAEVLPPGWITLKVQVDKENSVRGDTLELCSNYCLALVARDRAEADGTPITKKRSIVYSDKAKVSINNNLAKARHTKDHVNRDIVDPDCEFCDELTKAKE